jgi:hypothetical protein
MHVEQLIILQLPPLQPETVEPLPVARGLFTERSDSLGPLAEDTMELAPSDLNADRYLIQRNESLSKVKPSLSFLRRMRPSLGVTELISVADHTSEEERDSESSRRVSSQHSSIRSSIDADKPADTHTAPFLHSAGITYPPPLQSSRSQPEVANRHDAAKALPMRSLSVGSDLVAEVTQAMDEIIALSRENSERPLHDDIQPQRSPPRTRRALQASSRFQHSSNV